MSTVKKVATGSSAKDVKDNVIKAANPNATKRGMEIAKLELKHESDDSKMFETLHSDVRGFKGDFKGYTDYRQTFGMAYADKKKVKLDSARKQFDRWIKRMMEAVSPSGNTLFKFEVPVKIIKAASVLKNEKRAEEAAEDADGSGAEATAQDKAMSLATTTREDIAKYTMDHIKTCRKAKIKPNQSALDKMVALAKKLS